MPGLINITRGAAAPVMRRGDVATGMVFSVRDPATGRLGKKYANIGHNGRLYSVNVDSGEVSSSGNANSNVTIVGKWAFNVNRQYKPGVGRECTRADVRAGEIFVVKGGHTEYAHMGRITRDHNGWLSVPLARPQNHAVTENGRSKVTVVGTFTMDTTLSA